MRPIALALVFPLALLACGPQEPPPTLPETAANPTWFICDALDAARIYVVSREADNVEIAEYDKPNGAIIERMRFVSGEIEGAAGSFETPLLRAGEAAGMIRQTNNGMLENPASAFTPRVSLLQLNGESVQCRWLPRTRVMAFTGRRTIVVHEDADGDLIYTTYDLAAGAGPVIELSENASTTTFSLEVRGGEEAVGVEGTTYSFLNEGFRYVLSVGRDGSGALEVYREGEEARLQIEHLIAAQIGDGPS
jgi:hypothetical protein